MGSLKEIRNRISSVGSTQKITSAMKLVSAAKLRRAQTTIVNLRPYVNKLDTIVDNLFGGWDEQYISPLAEVRPPENVVLVMITSNRGLCGSFNSNVVKEVYRLIQEKYLQQAENGTLQFVCIGRKGYEQIVKRFEVIHYNETLLESSSFNEMAEIAQHLIDGFLDKKIDKVEIVYNQFVNPATQFVTGIPFLPVEAIRSDMKEKNKVDYIFEPSKDELRETLVPKILKTRLYKALLESIASEHGARMTTMAKATDNADEILKDLKLKYNNARQSSITTELLEIISGANALDG